MFFQVSHLPSFQIQAGGHTVIRLDVARKYKKGDWLDLGHAAAALPYCNVFVPDNAMHALLTSQPLNYDERFLAKIIRASALIDYLDRI